MIIAHFVSYWKLSSHCLHSITNYCVLVKLVIFTFIDLFIVWEDENGSATTDNNSGDSYNMHIWLCPMSQGKRSERRLPVRFQGQITADYYDYSTVKSYVQSYFYLIKIFIGSLIHAYDNWRIFCDNPQWPSFPNIVTTDLQIWHSCNMKIAVPYNLWHVAGKKKQ